MKPTILLCAAALALMGCGAFTAPPMASQALEKADTDASLIYVAVAQSVDAYKALPTTTPAQAAFADTVKARAWSALGVERQAYAAGQAIDLSTLNTLFATAHNLGSHE